MSVANLYVHFPFCRRKCGYCALYSRAGVSQAERDDYVLNLAREIGAERRTLRAGLRTVYFGGGSPALCNLGLLKDALAPLLPHPSSPIPHPSSLSPCEFTVELHPHDVTEPKLAELKALGVNRISMGVQSLDDAILADMGRGYTVSEAMQAFALVTRCFDNAGIDLIVGYPGEKGDVASWRAGLERFFKMGLKHCSVYSLQNERGLENVPDDDWTLDRLRCLARCLREIGLERYEISNYAVPGYECRHNLAVWRGEDYRGIGEGAYGRIGLVRTVGRKTGVETSKASPEEDLKERTLFRLRTRDGLDAARFPEWGQTLGKYVQEGLLTQEGAVYRLTERGSEVCDSILADLV